MRSLQNKERENEIKKMELIKVTSSVVVEGSCDPECVPNLGNCPPTGVDCPPDKGP